MIGVVMRNVMLLILKYTRSIDSFRNIWWLGRNRYNDNILISLMSSTWTGNVLCIIFRDCDKIVKYFAEVFHPVAERTISNSTNEEEYLDQTLSTSPGCLFTPGIWNFFHDYVIFVYYCFSWHHRGDVRLKSMFSLTLCKASEGTVYLGGVKLSLPEFVVWITIWNANIC